MLVGILLFPIALLLLVLLPLVDRKDPRARF
jgi:hypothetical protein